MTDTAPNFNGAYRPTASELGLLPLNEATDVVVGDTVTVLVRPANRSILVMAADAGDWRLKVGTYDNEGDNPAFPGDPVTTTTTDNDDAGSAYWKLTEGKEIAIAAPSELTVAGADSNSILTYYWV